MSSEVDTEDEINTSQENVEGGTDEVGVLPELLDKFYR
jgi:hypothetical protein